MNTRTSTFFFIVGVALCAVPALAVDGVIEINDASALAGGVTAGDTPGYPVTITESGSYRLTSNLTVADENTDAVRIQANDVTLDLNGFTIKGPTVCSGTPVTGCAPTGSGDGVVTSLFPEQSNVSVVNGSIVGMGQHGIFVSNNTSVDVRVERVRAISNGGKGIFIANGIGGCTVTGNTANRNGSDGISVVGGCTVSGNTAHGNGSDGIDASFANLFIGNTLTTNSGVGLRMILGVSGYTDNVISGNTGGTVSGGMGVEIGTNLCNTNTTCP